MPMRITTITIVHRELGAHWISFQQGDVAPNIAHRKVVAALIKLQARNDSITCVGPALVAYPVGTVSFARKHRARCKCKGVEIRNLVL